MSQNSSADSAPPTKTPSNPTNTTRKPRFRIWRLMLKELRETLRDRRTLITLILMPLLVYPALSLVFKTFLLNNFTGPTSQGTAVRLRIAYSGDLPQEQIDPLIGRFRLMARKIEWGIDRELAKRGGGDRQPAADAYTPFSGLQGIWDHRWQYVPIEPADEDPEDSLAQLIDYSLELEQGFDVGVYVTKPDPDSPIGYQIRILYRNDSLSLTAAEYLNYWFQQTSDAELRARLQQAGIISQPAWTAQLKSAVGNEGEATPPVPLASIIPLVLVLMTITGAVYPAIDLTAGERERGTLETLMAAPIPRVGILFCKFVSVVLVATLTAMLNLAGMFATIWAFQLDKQFGLDIFQISTIAQILVLLVLFAGFFSSLLLLVTSFAKSFKEAQVYLIPIILVSLGPGLMTMAPGMELTGFNAICPMVNVLLLARDVINGSVDTAYGVIAVLSTFVYGVIALVIAARLFGSDAILHADANSLKEVVFRSKKTRWATPLSATVLCTLLLVPLNFAATEWLNRFSGTTSQDFAFRFIMLAVALVAMFVVLPSIIAWHQRVDFKQGFGLKVPHPLFLVGGVLLGISLWPIVMWLTTAWHDLYGVIAGDAARDAWNDRLVEMTRGMAQRIQSVPVGIIISCLAIAPAVCEEFFFRGMLQRSVLKSGKPWQAIAASAVIFGLFHTISASVIAIDRFIPTCLIGIILGYIAYRSDSLWPGVLLHLLHNACVSLLAHYQQQLAQQPWFPADDTIPWQWAGMGLVLTMIGIATISSLNPATKHTASPATEQT